MVTPSASRTALGHARRVEGAAPDPPFRGVLAQLLRGTGSGGEGSRQPGAGFVDGPHATPRQRGRLVKTWRYRDQRAVDNAVDQFSSLHPYPLFKNTIQLTLTRMIA